MISRIQIQQRVRIQADILGQVKVAMRAACDEMLEFTDDPAKIVKDESLIKLQVARAIATLNGPAADPYKIVLEECATAFAHECRPLFRFRHPTPNKFTRRSRTRPTLTRPGRIDVAIYTHGLWGYQPLCAIEVKGFNKGASEAIKDWRRNLELMRVTDATGPSVLAFTVFVALDSFQEHQTADQIEANERLAKARYQSWLGRLGPIDDVQLGIETWTVRNEPSGRVVDDGEYEVFDSACTHQFVGTIVCFAARH